MKLIRITLFFVGTLAFVSCSKEQKEQATSFPNYSQLAVGNYWVYQRYEIDSSFGNETATGIFDSCYVEKDTLINGFTYFKVFRGLLPNEDYWIVRDSLHYLVKVGGEVLFSSQDFQNILAEDYVFWGANDTVTRIETKMADKDKTVTTPAGSFVTSNSQEIYYLYPNWANAGNPRYINRRYAENIGIVSEILPFFASNPNYVERRLVRYHVN